MAIKDLFRRRSKSRSRSNSKGNDLSRSTTPTPAAALDNAGSSSAANTLSPRDRASTPNLASINATGTAANHAAPYESRSAGRPPSIGSTPLHGNGPVGEDRARARSVGTGRSATPTATGTTTTMIGGPSSVTTTTTTTTQTSTGSRPGSRQSHKQGKSTQLVLEIEHNTMLTKYFHRAKQKSRPWSQYLHKPRSSSSASSNRLVQRARWKPSAVGYIAYRKRGM